jgi:CRP-like cAMP-binding protein
MGRTVRPDPGHVLAHEGTPPAEVHLLLEGEVVTRKDPLPPQQRAAPLAVGLEEALCGGRHGETVRSREGVICLVVGAPELLALVAEDGGLLRALFRGALAGAGNEAKVLRSRLLPGRPAESASRTLEQIRLLEGSPLFAKATPDQLLCLAEIAREVPLAQDAVLGEESDPAALHFIDEGEVALGDGSPVLAGAGDTIGALETLSGAPAVPARATAAGRALRLEADSLFERLADDTDLLQGIFSVARTFNP